MRLDQLLNSLPVFKRVPIERHLQSGDKLTVYPVSAAEFDEFTLRAGPYAIVDTDEGDRAAAEGDEVCPSDNDAVTRFVLRCLTTDEQPPAIKKVLQFKQCVGFSYIQERFKVVHSVNRGDLVEVEKKPEQTPESEHTSS